MKERMIEIKSGSKNIQIDLNKTNEYHILNKLVPSRYSYLFLIEVFLMNYFCNIEYESIFREIRCLEDINLTSSTKTHSVFLHPPLKGLYKKHYFNLKYFIFSYSKYK